MHREDWVRENQSKEAHRGEDKFDDHGQATALKAMWEHRDGWYSNMTIRDARTPPMPAQRNTRRKPLNCGLLLVPQIFRFPCLNAIERPVQKIADTKAK